MIVDVSVIITCFEKERFLDEAINSVLSQTKTPKDIVVVHDGCSSPVSHKGARTIILGKNEGVASSRRIGVENSTGKLILFLDADDYITPEFIENSVLTISSGADVAYPQMLIWYKDSPFKEQNRLYPISKKLTAKNMFKMCRIPVTSLMKRTVFEALGGFDNLPIFEDWLFWLKAISRKVIFKRTNAIMYYRQTHDSRNHQIDETKRQIMRQIKEMFVLKKTTKGYILCEHSTRN